MFRILFGALMAFAMARFLAKGWVKEFYVDPTFFFTYPGFSWVRPLSGAWMHFVVSLVGVAALGVAAGCYYRVSAATFFVGFTYLELIDKTTYLNHYYLVSLLAGLLLFLPAHRAFSVDAWQKPVNRSDWIPFGIIGLLRFQIGLVYFFAGLAKLNGDWLFRAQPLRIWLRAHMDVPMIGPWLAETWVAFAASWAGAIFDLTIVFFLMRQRTRAVAYLAVVVFHVATALLFRIGMFPWIMMASALIFFPPDYPRRWLGQQKPPMPAAHSPLRRRWLFPAGLYCAIQLWLPMRAWFTGGDSGWDYGAFNFSWRVMLVEKRGAVEFTATDAATRRVWRVSPREYLTPRQEMMMAQDPAMIQALARHVARGSASAVEIRADAFATLNGHSSRRLIDPKADLVSARLADCVLPFSAPEEGLPEGNAADAQPRQAGR